LYAMIGVATRKSVQWRFSVPFHCEILANPPNHYATHSSVPGRGDIYEFSTRPLKKMNFGVLEHHVSYFFSCTIKGWYKYNISTGFSQMSLL
jgi:hypothetical protein